MLNKYAISLNEFPRLFLSLFELNIPFRIGDLYDYGASRPNSGTQSGLEINKRRSGMSKNYDNRIFKMWFQFREKKRLPLKK